MTHELCMFRKFPQYSVQFDLTSSCQTKGHFLWNEWSCAGRKAEFWLHPGDGMKQANHSQSVQLGVSTPITSPFQTSCQGIQIKQTDKHWLCINKEEEEEARTRCSLGIPSRACRCFVCGVWAWVSQSASAALVTFGVIYRIGQQRTEK